MFVTAPSSPPELQTNTINAENLTEGPVASGISDVPHATPSNNPPAPKIPFWRRIFRRSKGNNSTPDVQQTRRKRWCF
ncbi:hypothetical protein AGABI2DRAFT_136996 [Agaricus bisporus var. bisporus H97]|uniref:hypothetical protein n=1 Tax=Agaricus bisporus var. bisporus (strain H97 / ATCC MYA-4626 / FGSC 10389) TaxID=936046 RepID=UPI00029F7DD6|nr:hypothetical protein AGABI2DRAFT_136996 [Agaricus bisporus var. bisporus H97]EKV46874.1 hypothetical protein AGABI2DRAFT_136996 [Agaricus bisporus var. bisporus H97]